MKQKLFTLFLALIASVGTTFAARDVVPSDAVLKNYYKTGQLCVCIFVPAEMACNDVVFVGTYNRDASDAWITDVKTLAKFEPVEGYDGWYVIAVNDETPADFQDKGIQGKPVVLDRDGNFNWAYQVGDVTVIRGGVTVVDGYVGEIDLVGYTKDVPNVFTIDALKANANPCTAVYHDYTFTVISDGCEGFAVPYLVGSMTDWGFQQMQVNVEKTQELGAPVYYYKCRCAEGTRYQVLSGLKAADGAIIEQPTWDNDSYLLQLVDDVWVRYTENGNVDLTTGANVNITFDVRQKNLRWARCAAPEEAYEVAVSLTAPAGAPAAGVEIIGDFDNWMGTHMILKNGVYTATITATASQVFKFREAGTWDNELLIANPEAVGGWKEYPDTQFQLVWEPAAEKGKMVINLDLSNPTMYRWKETQTISGTCGDNLTWTLADSVLTISGTGAMADYPSATMPWYDYRSSIKTVAISDGVTSIGILAFYGCTSLTSIAIPNSLTSIGDGAFYDCYSLASVTIPISVTSIGFQAFSTCSSLTSITIPNSVTSIGYGTFQDCTSLASVTIGNSVTSIGDYAFGNCSSLTSVTIPNCVTSIGNSAFRNCSSLTSVTFEGLRAPVIGSNVFINTNNCPIYVPCGTKEAYLTALNVNNTIDESRVKEPVIASGTCGDNLTWELSCNSVLTVSGIGAMADYEYSIVPWYDYRSSIKSIVIDDGVTSIGKSAFYGCSSLTSITIPNSVTSIGHDAFWNCESLTSVTIPNSVTSIGNSVFSRCSKLTSITIPNSVTSIGDYAFNGCKSLASVIIGNSLTSIGKSAFEGCKSLTSPVYNAHCFAYMPTSYSGVYAIPEGIKQIAGGAFYNCSSLTSVTIPNSVTSIGELAFYGCSSLTSVTIPNSVTSIGDHAFYNCSSLTSINVEAYNSKYSSADGVLFNKDKTTLLAYPVGKQGAYTIPNSVTSIGDDAFYWCTSLTSITIPNSVTSIGSFAFNGCSSLTSITIPNSVTSIRSYVFEYCSSLKSLHCKALTPPEVLTSSFGTDAYDNVTLHVPFESIADYKADRIWGTFKNIQYIDTFYNDEICYKYITQENVLSQSLKNEANFNLFTKISLVGSQTWHYDSQYGAKMSGFQNDVTHKNEDWLISPTMDLSQYSSATLDFVHTFGPKGSLPTTAVQKAQYTCWISNNFDGDVTTATWTELPITYNTSAWSFITTTVDIPAENLKENCHIAWKYVCENSAATWEIASVTISGNFLQPNVKVIAKSSKYSNDIIIPSIATNNNVEYTVTTIAASAFSDCPSLTSITIPNSVTSIGSYAFNGCTSLKSITIPNSITSLYNNTFANCTSLNEIILPASIISIGENVFAGCTKLYDVYCYAMEPPTAYESSFANYNAFLHVPCECQRVYLLDVLFGNFKYIECISSDNTTADEIVVTPSENEVNVIWPTVNGAASYELVIKDKNGNIVCTLIFNANGQLTSIAFNAPSRNGVPAQTQNAGFSFTITGLDSSTGYDLTLTAKDNSGNAIQTETISFITTGGNVSTDIDQLQGHKVQSTKVIKDGQVLILRNGKTYTLQGQEVK